MKRIASIKSRTLANTRLERLCLEKGVRLTSCRRVMLAIMGGISGHLLTIEEIYCRGMEAEATISLSTVYANMRVFVKVGVVERFQCQANQARYALSSEGSCDRFVDTQSGKVINIRSETLDVLKAEIAQEYDYKVADFHVELHHRPVTKNKPNRRRVFKG